MQMPDTPLPPRPPHPARHVFSIPGMILTVLFILASFFAAAFYVSSVLTSGGMAAVISSVLIELTNDDREKAEIPALTRSAVLTSVAQAKADHMAENGYFAHVSPDGIEPWHWFEEAGYVYTAAGENLAVNFSDSENVEEAWMNSPSHRANILSARFTEIGIATAVGEYKGKKTTFVVQMFGTPRTETVKPSEVTAITPSIPEDIAIVVRADEPEILGSEVATVTPATEEAVKEPAIELPSSPAPARLGLVERTLTTPQDILRAVYVVCGLAILFALILTTRMELRRHHVRHVVAATFLLVFLGGALVLADRFIFTEPLLAEASGNLQVE